MRVCQPASSSYHPHAHLTFPYHSIRSLVVKMHCTECLICPPPVTLSDNLLALFSLIILHPPEMDPETCGGPLKISSWRAKERPTRSPNIVTTSPTRGSSSSSSAHFKTATLRNSANVLSSKQIQQLCANNCQDDSRSGYSKSTVSFASSSSTGWLASCPNKFFVSANNFIFPSIDRRLEEVDEPTCSPSPVQLARK